MSTSGSGLLLDTHAFLWWAMRDPRVSRGAHDAIASIDNAVVVSVVTPWEIAIKHALGRLELAESPRELVDGQIARHGYQSLDVGLEHVLAAGELPPHHGDPFDRLLIAQAKTEGLALVSADAVFSRYGVSVLW